MAEAAIRVGRQMISGFAFRNEAVVAGLAVAGDTGVIEPRTGERICVVAVIARSLRRDVAGGLTHGDHVVMAVGAGTYHLGMVNANDRNPGTRTMTRVAGIAGWDMVHRLASRGNAVVTTHTLAKHLVVVYDSRNPSRCHMAAIAVSARGNVTRGFTGCIRAVVATHAGARHCAVIEQTCG